VDALLTPVLEAPNADPKEAMALVAASSPKAVGAEVQAMTLAAAQHMADTEAALAGGEQYLMTGVAMQAVAGGRPDQVRTAAGVLRPQDLSDTQMNLVQARIEAMKMVDDPALKEVEGKIRERKTSGEQIKAQVAAKAARVPSPLARQLLEVLRQFDTLYHPYVATLTVSDLEGSGSPFYSPFVPLAPKLRAGLAEAASLWPYELPAALVPGAIPIADGADETTLREAASTLGGDALLLCRIRVTGLLPQTVVDLALFDPARGVVEKVTTVLPGLGLHLVETADWVWSAAIVFVLSLVIWGLAIYFRGTVEVRVHYQTDSHDELFTIELSRTPETPELGDQEAYRERLQGMPSGQTGRKAWGTGRLTRFRRVPRGKWYVSLYGVYQMGKRWVVVNDSPIEIEVHARKASEVLFDLQHREAEFQVIVYDGRTPVSGARVWVDGNVQSAAVTDAGGNALVKVSHGYRILHVTAKGVTIQRPYHVIKTKRHEMMINLELERRRDSVSRALEDQQEDPPGG
jgi:hypothetical protein